MGRGTRSISFLLHGHTPSGGGGGGGGGGQLIVDT